MAWAQVGGSDLPNECVRQRQVGNMNQDLAVAVALFVQNRVGRIGSVDDKVATCEGDFAIVLDEQALATHLEAEHHARWIVVLGASAGAADVDGIGVVARQPHRSHVDDRAEDQWIIVAIIGVDRDDVLAALFGDRLAPIFCGNQTGVDRLQFWHRRTPRTVVISGTRIASDSAHCPMPKRNPQRAILPPVAPCTVCTPLCMVCTVWRRCRWLVADPFYRPVRQPGLTRFPCASRRFL